MAMLLKVSTVVILFSLFIQCTLAFERAITVSKEATCEDRITNDVVTATGTTGSGSGNCCCTSLYNALTNLTSNTSNVLINITTDVLLSSIIPLVDLANITITGYNNPTVNCNNSGGVHFMSCNNCTIEGIIWNECGFSDDRPVLQLQNSTKITIKNCTFQNSTGQAVVLSEMMGDVNIDHCDFLSNKQYEGHGTAIHYSSNDKLTGSLITFNITSSNFQFNERAKSVVYFGQLSCKYLIIQNSKFSNNNATPVYLSNQNLHIGGNVEFNGNIAEDGGGMFISDYSNVTFHKSAIVNFTHNRANNNGGAIFLTNHSSILFKEHLTYDGKKSLQMDSITAVFYKNRAKNGGAIYASNSNIMFEERTMVNNADQEAAMAYDMCIFEGASTVSFVDNVAENNGGAVEILEYSNLTFTENITVTFLNNSAANIGGAMRITDNCNVTFEETSTVICHANNAIGGGCAHSENSVLTFKQKSKVFFSNNNALIYYGGAVVVYDHSTISFEDNTTVIFNGNTAGMAGGAIRMLNAVAIFEGNSNVTFNANRAHDYGGGACIVEDLSNITFKGNSLVTFLNNSVNSYASGDKVLRNIIYDLTATRCGGALTTHNSTVLIEENSTITFNSNTAIEAGGAMRLSHTVVRFGGNANVTFNANRVNNGDGGACLINKNSKMIFTGNSTVIFFNNSVDDIGGAIRITTNSTVTFEETSTVTFTGNSGYEGGALIVTESLITFEGNSKVNFTNNTADTGGGALLIENLSNVKLTGNVTLTFFNNFAEDNGGAMKINDNCNVTFEDNSSVTFDGNGAYGGGGAVYCANSIFKLKENSQVLFIDNGINPSAIMLSNHYANTNGGALYMGHNSTLQIEGDAAVSCINNSANFGGTLFTESSKIIIQENSSIALINNIAFQNGGAIYLSDHSNFTLINGSKVTFSNNVAGNHGGAIYALLQKTIINFNSIDIHFKDNTARTVHNSFYVNVPKSCNGSCVFHNINKQNFSLVTSPRTLKLYHPAKCINDNGGDCDTYFMENIMLGQEIAFDACLLDYYNQPTEAAQFSITGMNHQDYNISGSNYFSLSCNRTIQDMAIIGNLYSNKSYNYSIHISLYVTRISDSKLISVTLMVELTRCHPGFQYSNESQKCECYNQIENIIYCTGTNSTIKRGYWFGRVDGKPTVTSCPNDYCNFTCCETTNGIYHLHPIRANQCRGHRTGTACGECEMGYTLSFDSPQCVRVGKCTIGHTILVTTLSMLFLIAAVVTVFAMMYFKVTIGSLYAIVYYYSVVDILLDQVLFMSNGLYTTVSIMSSLAKLTPKFLGQLCLARNMSGVDQQFIHYVYPVVVMIILIIISMLARRSRRFSSFVNRGIIHFVCFFLLLSYTSMATTSLLLLRPLTFVDIDKVYTYLSPDFEYFHGRHLAYGIVAIIFTIVIVIGFPLLLSLEPFLNSKINFVKIKPLLDQFQGCYKDKYRCFAGYYMICRLVIILLVIIKISDNFTTQYLLISSCALMQLIHVLVRPYASTFYNVFDGIILQLIMIISVLPTRVVDDQDELFVTVIIYLLIILPLISFIAIKVWINKKNIQITIGYFRRMCSCKYMYRALPTDDPDKINEDAPIVYVDDDMRKNSTLVDINQLESSEERLPKIMQHCDPLMEQLNEIEALNDIRN